METKTRHRFVVPVVTPLSLDPKVLRSPEGDVRVEGDVLARHQLEIREPGGELLERERGFEAPQR
jgi:hypothetical protein